MLLNFVWLKIEQNLRQTFWKKFETVLGINKPATTKLCFLNDFELIR